MFDTDVDESGHENGHEGGAAERPAAAVDRAEPAVAQPRGGFHLRRRLLGVFAGEAGMSTVEYAIGSIAAAAFGAVLYTVVTGGDVVSALTGIIGRALSTSV